MCWSALAEEQRSPKKKMFEWPETWGSSLLQIQFLSNHWQATEIPHWPDVPEGKSVDMKRSFIIFHTTTSDIFSWVDGEILQKACTINPVHHVTSGTFLSFLLLYQPGPNRGWRWGGDPESYGYKKKATQTHKWKQTDRNKKWATV